MTRTRFISSFTALLVLLCLAFPALGEDTLTITLAEPLLDGADVLCLRIGNMPPEGLRVNAFCDGQSIGESAEIGDDGLVRLHLARRAAEGEEVCVAADVMTDGAAAARGEAVFTVLSRFASHLARLRARADGFWSVWNDVWLPAFRDGKVYLRIRSEAIPFITYPDEAPEIAVEEEDGKARLYVSETVPEDWQVFFASGLPAEMTDTVRDESGRVFTGEAGFDSVYLVSPQDAERVGVTIVYQRADGFRASCPIVEWVAPDAEDPYAFNCYSFGTARNLSGTMYAIVGDGAAWYADYDIRGTLVSCTDLYTECVYDINGNLVSGGESGVPSQEIVLW